MCDSELCTTLQLPLLVIGGGRAFQVVDLYEETDTYLLSPTYLISMRREGSPEDVTDDPTFRHPRLILVPPRFMTLLLSPVFWTI